MRLSLGCHTRRGTISGVSDHRQDRERGALSLLVVVLFAVLLGLAGLVVDGGAKLTADENAVALAQEAARAGATSVNVSSAYASGSFVVDQGLALYAARSYLVSVGCHQFSALPDGARAIRVSVTITEPTKFLSLIGIDSFTSNGTATASLVTGVTGGA
jgi:Putative Flp pilus-assembly TadE/G-like